MVDQRSGVSFTSTAAAMYAGQSREHGVRILVCGGAGYIGSHMVRHLLRERHVPIVFDNLSTGHPEAVAGAQLIVGDVMDGAALAQTFATERIDAVVHLCARSIVAESVAQPYLYYQTNVAGTLNLLQAMRDAAVDRLVFSSSAAVYGHPKTAIFDESHPTEPVNPYGSSKLMAERILEDAARAYGLRCVALRYFNAAGADVDGDIGESHQPETHLIPNILRAALSKRDELKVFGTDYETPDGTCIRDYIHVSDLVSAHLKALHFMQRSDGAHAFNLGNGKGFSVLEIIQAAEHVTRRAIHYDVHPRRLGDPATLVASNELARTTLGWQPRQTDIGSIIASAWNWHRQSRY